MRTDSFAVRHIGPQEGDLDKMLNVIGAESLDQLIFETIPDDILLKENSIFREPSVKTNSFTIFKNSLQGIRCSNHISDWVITKLSPLP